MKIEPKVEDCSEYFATKISTIPDPILFGKYIYRYGPTRAVFILLKVYDQLIILERLEADFKVINLKIHYFVDQK